MAVELSITHFQVCQDANGQFCSITTPFQPLANPPSCVSALYARNPAGITSRCLLQIRKKSDVNLPTQDITGCLDPYNSTLYTSKHHHVNMF